MTGHFPVPKPQRKPRERKPLKSGGRVRPVNKERKAAEFARTYHSVERVEFVKSMACIFARAIAAAACDGGVENCHVCDDGTKGAGRKSGYRCVAPACWRHHRLVLHRYTPEVIKAVYGLDLEAEAAATQSVWEAVSGGGE